MGTLNGKVAVVTGGTRGLGLGIARAFAKAGASVVVASRSQAAVNEAVAQIEREGGKASGFTLDVSDLEQVQALAKIALETYGRLDIWVNNAGVSGPYGPTLDCSPQVITQVVQTNILGVYNGSRAALKIFTAQGSGKLINIIGRGYNNPVPFQNAYASSKAWVKSFTKALAEETKSSGVGVFAFSPGMVLTDMLTNVNVIDGSQDKLKFFPAVVRMWAYPPEAPAQKAVWLASSATDGKTGLLIDFLTPGLMLKGAIKEGMRALFRKPAAGEEISIRCIPSD